ncbi:cytochrome P450 71A1-like [Typha angustifolia]|uniref:cytochrome P450 71A1-like n=1 Tax=Typha angustifolia TaxID=59011 RepID=UPI003C2CCA29
MYKLRIEVETDTEKLDEVRAMLPLLDQAFLLFLLSLFFFFFLTIIKRSFSSHNPNIPLPPSPPKLPFIGNLHQIGPLLHQSLHSLSSTYGPLMHLRLGQIPTLIVSSADMAAEITKTHDAIFATRPSFKVAEILTYNFVDLVFAPYGEYWKQVRKICTKHLLSPRREGSYHPMKEEEVGFMVERIGADSLQPSPVDLSEVLFDFANDVICRAVSGKFFREEGRNRLFRILIEENTALLSGFHLGDYFPKLGWLDGVFGVIKRTKRTFTGWDNVLEEVIKEHREGIKDGGDEDFTDVLLSLQEDPDLGFELKDDNVKSLLADMFAAGTETSYAALEWAMAELVRNPEVMKKLVDEVRGIASQNQKVTAEDLNKMSYLKVVVKETLRLHPPVPLFIPRESMEECHVGGYYIPKGTRVIINAWSISRDPNFWKSPNEYIPERFINTHVDFRGKDFHFIPFGAGRRICPGMQFALSTLELALANLIHRFDWELPPNGFSRTELDMEEASGLTTTRKNRLKLIAKPFVFPK